MDYTMNLSSANLKATGKDDGERLDLSLIRKRRTGSVELMEPSGCPVMVTSPSAETCKSFSKHHLMLPSPGQGKAAIPSWHTQPCSRDQNALCISSYLLV